MVFNIMGLKHIIKYYSCSFMWYYHYYCLMYQFNYYKSNQIAHKFTLNVCKKYKYCIILIIISL